MDIRLVMGGGLSRMKYKQDEKKNNKNGPPPLQICNPIDKAAVGERVPVLSRLRVGLSV